MPPNDLQNPTKSLHQIQPTWIKKEQRAPVRKSMDILIDAAIVYLFVPFWISLFACILQRYHVIMQWGLWQNAGDLLIFPAIFITVAMPLTYLRFKASKASHFLHSYRVETDEVFLMETRDNLPSLFKKDILMNVGLITTMNLSGIFEDDSELSNTSFCQMWCQSLILLWLFDASTYWGHRMVHNKKYYKYHKQHHNVRNTVAICLIDIDLADFFINNLALLCLPIMFYAVGLRMVYEVWIILDLHLYLLRDLLFILICISFLHDTVWDYFGVKQ